SGEIYIDGKAINYQQVVKLRRQMGYVVQGSGLFPHLNTLENISIIAKREGWKKQDILVQAHRILETVNLDPDEFLYKYPKQMSGGQQQRVSIARSLFLSPKIMLMDEAFGALDPNTRTEIQDFFLELREKYPLTVILVTHDVAEALKMSDEIIVLNSGRVEQMGSPSDLVKTPKSRYVSNYINIINRQSMLFQKLYGNNN
ncbi:MAG: ATP-binding cassette domain-containing protein, partial [Bdellovibrionales bacterium]|nr:ATP-binding cassette domain-containing protein [Bdellovibrionales bacterium]